MQAVSKVTFLSAVKVRARGETPGPVSSHWYRAPVGGGTNPPSVLDVPGVSCISPVGWVAWNVVL